MSSLIVQVLVVLCLAAGGVAPVSPQKTTQKPTTKPSTSSTAPADQSVKPDVATIRRLIAAGGVNEARHLLATAPTTREYQELRFDLERHVKNIPAAVTAWEALAAGGSSDWNRLRALATDLASELRTSDDPVVRVQACGVLLRAKQRDCARDLQLAGGDTALPWNLRLQALKELATYGDARAKDELVRASSEAVSADPTAALQAMTEADPIAAVATFSAVLTGSSKPPDQYQAAYLLGDAGVRSKEAKAQAAQALTGFLEMKPRGPARVAAIISLARVGDAEHVEAVRQQLQQLSGYDRLMAAVALAERGSPEAPALIRSTASTLSEQLQLEAAVRMAPWDRDAAVALLAAQTRSQSPVARLAALQAWPQIKAAPPKSVRGALADADQGVRIAAAVAITSPFAPAATPVRRQ
jgi:HEAT repeat protein